ncbi:hypothetical protein E2C01_080898 [Portunus trituberculatus]|uniref:Uncharacterized protein n=1 Tax=Portunus trituberculatus TaxID=210409 RepID=A0A5B7J0T9_PORTR|nr:hypothetical protein [Portunus trituberculatus]
MRDGGDHQRGRMSAITRFKQSVSHGKERKPEQPSPASPWVIPCSELTCTAYCRTTLETIEHFLLQCLRFYSHHTALCSRLSALAITTLDLPTLLAASVVHPSRQPAVLSLTSAFLRKTGQLPRL